MNWQKEAIEDLRGYETLKEGIKSIKIRIASLDECYKALKTENYEADIVKGGKSAGAEEMMLDNIAERERLKLILEANTLLSKRIEQGLDSLDPVDRMVLEEFFIKGRKKGMLELTRNLAYEKSKIYMLRSQALKQFTLFMYGITEF